MIEIHVMLTNEIYATAEAEDPESAVLAGRTLWDEAYEFCSGCFKPKVYFLVEGKLTTVSERRP